ncbi:hypothetical protein AXX12_00100 [Anaerosporomusa subterranea]|uniref:Gamma-glutamylcyclotransferase AIG2-like domain-containing protein n=1 Tax=Anaerosporomusa subterranea TaxID=1794912 RepID=A0A154BVC8_ANASB|nr:gamma-glutamylcyclotransferase family protein [Anaerosporomusa subterranea]KYZ77984.1 hypothetical protein AXX12_00100 [Anaerosporomusa subterranea]
MNQVFVYGTLLQGMENYHLIAGFVSTIRPAVINGGTIYHLEFGYPALVLTNDQNQVHGEIIELVDMEQALLVLDNLEGYLGENCPDNLYDRVICRAFDENGRPADTYVYVWSHPDQLKEIGQLLRDGCWRSFIAQR